MAGYVYLIWVEGTDKYKIGSSAYPNKRVKELQTGCPLKLRLICEKLSETPDFEEKKLHDRFADFRTIGEFFCFSPLAVYEVFGAFDVTFPSVNNDMAQVFSSGVKAGLKIAEDEIKKKVPAMLQNHSESMTQKAIDAFARFAGVSIQVNSFWSELEVFK